MGIPWSAASSHKPSPLRIVFTCQGISAPPAPKLNMVGASKAALLAVLVFCLAGTLVSCNERFDRSYSSEGSEAASLTRKRDCPSCWGRGRPKLEEEEEEEGSEEEDEG